MTAILLGLISNAWAEELTTPSIIAKTIAALPSCLEFELVGQCFWLSWDGISRTNKVSHYVPDAVVTVYPSKESNPWKEANILYDAAAYKTTETLGQELDGGQMSATASPYEQHLRFKEVDIIGNPALWTFGNPLLLPSVATPFELYYHSVLDFVSWRTSREFWLKPLEHVPGKHELGQWPKYSWGSIYPRIGAVPQGNDAKAAAVQAFRAAHIATHDAGSATRYVHVANRLSNHCGVACTVKPVTENSSDTMWQMLSPIAHESCEVFADRYDGIVPGREWGLNAQKEANGRYAWNVWRHYEGCIQGDGAYIGEVSW